MAETFLPDEQKFSQSLQQNRLQDSPSLETLVQDTPSLVSSVQDTSSLVRQVPDTSSLVTSVQAATFSTMSSQQDAKPPFLLTPPKDFTSAKDVTPFKKVASQEDIAYLQDQETQAGEFHQQNLCTTFKDEGEDRSRRHLLGDHDYSTTALPIKSEEAGLERLCQEELNISLDSIMAEEASYQQTTEVASIQLVKSEESRYQEASEVAISQSVKNEESIYQFTEKDEIGNKVIKEEEAIIWLDTEQEGINQLSAEQGYGNKLITEWSTEDASYQIINENEATPHFQLTVLEEKDGGMLKMGQPSEVKKALPNPFTDLFSNRRKGQVTGCSVFTPLFLAYFLQIAFAYYVSDCWATLHGSSSGQMAPSSPEGLEQWLGQAKNWWVHLPTPHR